ncbi:MAG: hypothetical protein ACLP8A_03575 [Methylovirgula sp.]
MRLKHVLTWLALPGLMAAAATPALAHDWYWSNPPSYYYQGPEGGYDSASDFSSSVWGVPCDYQCTLRAERRWHAVPPDPFREYFFPWD